MRSFGWPELFFLVEALRWTIVLSAAAFVGGGIVGLLVAALRTAPVAWLRWSTRCYIELFQGTPVLMQLFIAYYGIPVITGVQIAPWPAVTMALTLYAAAFLGEIWRGTIESIPRGQWEAAKSLGLRYRMQLWLIILPQAMRIAIPPTVGFLVQVIKSTAIASIIGFIELMREGQIITNVTFQPMVVYPVVAALYFVLCWPLSALGRHLEKRIGAGRIDLNAGFGV
ncbi:MAG: amino acid ABC transporter permease [Acetobacteraceae bacterium]